MKYAVSNWIFLNEQLEKGFKRLKDTGFSYLEMVGEPRNYVIDTIIEFAQYYDLEIIGLLANIQYPTYERDLLNPNVNNRTKTIEYIKSCLEFGNQIDNCKIFTMPVSPRWKIKPLMSIKEEWTYAVEGLRKIGKLAEDYDMIIAIEPLNRYETYFIRTVDQALKLIKEVNMPDFIKIALNTFHMNIEEKDISQAIRKAGDNLINIHLSDSNRGVIGSGNIEWKSIIRALKEINYDKKDDRYITLEPFIFESDFIETSLMSTGEDMDNALKDCLAALKYIERIA
ncbi:MAG: sugar phosphate isomerase/epimerase family protein [Candidatus Helarchaeota archaeon]